LPVVDRQVHRVQRHARCPDLFELPLHTSVYEGEEVPVLDEWCEGYCKGIDIDREAWEPLIERHPWWFNIILLFGTASDTRNWRGLHG